jgi:glucose-1-phosphate cytidylyltransferase
MKAVILAGGLGTRLNEETTMRPKPMVEIICLGYKGYMIKEFFANYFLHTADVTFHMQENRMQVHGHHTEPWRVTLVDTGENTMTGGRLKRITPYVADEETFCMTYGDGVGDVDITALIAFHKKHGKLATLTAVQPRQRFGVLEREGDKVTAFREKAQADGAWINGGFFVLSPRVLDLIAGNGTTWEREPMEKLASDGNLRAFEHTGFWQPMDSLRDKLQLEALWAGGNAPWKIW